MSASQSVVEQVASAIAARADELVDRMFGRFYAEVPELAAVDDPDVLAAMRASTLTNLQAGAAHMLRGGSPLPFGPPADALAEARVAAQVGFPLGPVLQSYRIGQSVMFDVVLETIDARDDLDRGTRSAVLRACTQGAFAYIDAIVPLVSEEYSRERDRMVRGREARRVQLVRDLLDGQDVDAGAVGYELGVVHRAVVAWGPGADAALAQLADRLSARLLVVPASGQTVWAWLAGDRATGDRTVELTAVDWTGCGVALGRPAGGAQGFRASHREARAAHRIGLVTGAQCTYFDDVALESALLADERAARAFVAAELGPLDTGSESAKFRATLAAYFAAGFNAASAAATLGVSDRTIANRLATIERLLERSVRHRQTELQAALRLERVLRRSGRDDV